MSGLDKIIGTITGEAEEKVLKLEHEARQEADAITADGNARTGEETDRIRKKSLEEVAGIEARAQASAELRKKQILLAAKQEMITSCINKAKDYPSTLDDAAYIALLDKVFQKHVPNRNAVLRFNRQDLVRVPSETIQKFIALAKEKGSELKVSDEPASIRSGFVLDFGGIEENCSIDALIDQNLEEIQDRVYQALFA